MFYNDTQDKRLQKFMLPTRNTQYLSSIANGHSLHTAIDNMLIQVPLPCRSMCFKRMLYSELSAYDLWANFCKILSQSFDHRHKTL